MVMRKLEECFVSGCSFWKNAQKWFCVLVTGDTVVKLPEATILVWPGFFMLYAVEPGEFREDACECPANHFTMEAQGSLSGIEETADAKSPEEERDWHGGESVSEPGVKSQSLCLSP